MKENKLYYDLGDLDHVAITSHLSGSTHNFDSESLLKAQREISEYLEECRKTGVIQKFEYIDTVKDEYEDYRNFRYETVRTVSFHFQYIDKHGQPRPFEITIK